MQEREKVQVMKKWSTRLSLVQIVVQLATLAMILWRGLSNQRENVPMMVVIGALVVIMLGLSIYQTVIQIKYLAKADDDDDEEDED